MMEQGYQLYTIDDIYRAFEMGLDSAIYVLEKSLELSFDDRLYLLECLKKIVDCSKFI